MIDFEKTIISQYSSSSTICALVRNFNSYVDQTANFQAFYDYVWDVQTAQGFGLDIWGRIVNVSRNLTIPGTPDYFSFNGGTGEPFNQAPFNGGFNSTETYALSDDAYRTLILAKAISNISATTSPAINQLLQNLFAGRGRCYVADTGRMTLRYVFEFALTEFELAIVTQSGALPKPAGVQAYSLDSDDATTFGFNGSGGQPFNQGVFMSMSGLVPTK